MPLHPLLVHFPIAFLIGAGCAYVAWLLLRQEWLGKTALLLHGAGLLGCFAGILSGDSAEAALQAADPLHAQVELHETLAMISAWGFGMLCIWAWLRKQSDIMLEKVAFVVLFLALCVLIAVTAHTGGSLVYESGAGVRTLTP